MSKSLQEVLSALIFLNNTVHQRVLSEFKVNKAASSLKKINLKMRAIDKLLQELSLMNFDCNEDKIIDLLIALYKNLIECIGYMNAIRNATEKMVSDYRGERNRLP